MSEDVFSKLRVEYAGRRLREQDADADPLTMFGRWFDAAVAANIPLANAMTLATVDADGTPSARVVLLKAVDAGGFVFFTNYDSRKGHSMAADDRVALCFWWEPMHRQVRIEGRVERVTAAESDEYFATRPRQSNLSGMASVQSAEVADRETLEARVAALESEWDGRELQRPDNWGGYRVLPSRLELWQGQPDRLHDRLAYERDGDTWRIVRLCP